MEKQNLPKVLIIDVNGWRKDAGSNTLRDIFSCWNPDNLALVYTSSQLPDSDACHNYFQISENQVLKSVFHPTMKVGCKVVNTPNNDSKDATEERERYKQAHKGHSTWLRLAREVVWKLGHWKTDALKKFVKEFNPDVIFVPIFPTAYMGRIEQYIIRLTNKPTVCYLADDNYSYDSCSGLADYIHRFWTRQYVGPLARRSSKMFVIVDKEKEDTDSRFGTDSVILTKSIDFSGKAYTHHTPNSPLKFVYTGSLIIGRDKTLTLVADAINRVNAEYGETKAELFVYSQTVPDDQIMARIDSGSSHYCGCVPHQQIKGIQDSADVVVFAEALSGKEANAAKLSFSTKITDYISNGKCVLAIGKEYIAPIDYFKRNDAAVIACSEEDVFKRVKNIVDNPDVIDSYGEKAFNCAVRNHEKGMMEERFIDTIISATI